MKNILFIVSLSLISLTSVNAQLILEGTYRGENIYVKNPYSKAENRFCIYSIKVNGRKVKNGLKSNAFEINLSNFGFEKGDKVRIEIRHNNNCTPKIINPQAIKPVSTFITRSIIAKKNNTLKWTTSDEKGKLMFIVEQFRWKKWIKIGEVMGKGTGSFNTYTKRVRYHTGINRFRVKQISPGGKPRFSKEAKFRSMSKEVTFRPGNGNKTKKAIIFSAKTDYEIYNYYGKLQKKGFGSKVNITALRSGKYFINYDNKTETFEKK